MNKKIICVLTAAILTGGICGFSQEADGRNAATASENKAAGEKSGITDASIDSLIDRLENDDGQVREQAAEKLRKAGPEAVPRIINYGLKTKHHPFVRTSLISVLGSVHTEESRKALKKELNSKIAEVVAAAIEAIARHGDEQLINREILPLIHSENDIVRRKAVLTLGKYGFKSSVQGLCSLLKSEFEHIRIQALKELKKYPEMKDMIITSVAPLLEDTNPDVALEAAVTLQLFKDPRGDRFFRNQLDGKSIGFQEEAVRYIADYEISSAVPFLMKLLKHDQWYMRYIAVDALGTIKDPLAIPSLKILFENEKVKPVRIACARVLYAYQAPDTAEFLASGVAAEKNEDIRWFIVATLGAIGGDTVIGPLIKALEDSDEKIRIAAVTALRDITHKNFGYDPREKTAKRVSAVEQWQEWHRKQKKNSTEE